MHKPFEGKVVIVTGASSGIGAATALAFGRQGAKVVVAARRADKGEQVVRQIEALGAQALFIETDVTKTADVEALVARTLIAFERLDCAVNNAGIAGPAFLPVADIEESAWDEVMNTNLRAVWLCMKYEIRAMLIHGAGSIVNVSSIYGYKPSDLGHAACQNSRRRSTTRSKASASTSSPPASPARRWWIRRTPISPN